MSAKFRAGLDSAGLQRSMEATGCCYDNAVVESFFATLKKDLAYRTAWRPHDAARTEISAYINLFYNTCRRHSSLGFMSPAAFEGRHNRNQEAA